MGIEEIGTGRVYSQRYSGEVCRVNYTPKKENLISVTDRQNDRSFSAFLDESLFKEKDLNFFGAEFYFDVQDKKIVNLVSNIKANEATNVRVQKKLEDFKRRHDAGEFEELFAD